ncbi:hypothetical protein B0H63DRAFT_519169 [Podospora didyma]|uniref:Uncharacterized protein n=1 Tax=Podospora didyma TaxID=330526 RepID=A0AAE0U3X0_9PEZI|nr:hypothetical protein B0H63DRAFT_519169 [Podospora didyma]
MTKVDREAYLSNLGGPQPPSSGHGQAKTPFAGVAHPIPGELYLGYWPPEEKHFPVMVLPDEDEFGPARPPRGCPVLPGHPEAVVAVVDHLSPQSNPESSLLRRNRNESAWWFVGLGLCETAAYTGLHPPAGVRIEGVLYPRASTLGGCTARNGMVAFYPHQSDFQYMAALTSDNTCSPSNMRRLFTKLAKKQYGPPADEFCHFAFGNLTEQIFNIERLLGGDINSASPRRDTHPAMHRVQHPPTIEPALAAESPPPATLKRPRNMTDTPAKHGRVRQSPQRQPLDVVGIAFNYFETGSGGSAADLQASYEDVNLARDTIRRQPVETNETLPGMGKETEQEIKKLMKDGA